MLDPLIVAQVRLLLHSTDPHYSQRSIAKMLPVSRCSIANIALGRWHGPDERRDPHPTPRGPIGRCTTCGAKVEMPCRVCETRNLLKQLGVQTSRDRENGQLLLNLSLRGEDQERYDEIAQTGLRPEERAEKAEEQRAKGEGRGETEIVRTDDERQDEPCDPVYVHPLSDREEAFLDAFAFDTRCSVLSRR